jgi:hypothetical protein
MSMAQANIKVLNQISRSSPNASACLHPLFGPTFTLYTLYPLSVVPVFFFIGEFLQKFDLKNVISTTSKDFSMGKNGPNSPNLEKKTKFKSPDFYNKFH